MTWRQRSSAIVYYYYYHFEKILFPPIPPEQLYLILRIMGFGVEI